MMPAIELERRTCFAWRADDGKSRADPNRCPIFQGDAEFTQAKINGGEEESDEQERGQGKPGNASQCIPSWAKGWPWVRVPSTTAGTMPGMSKRTSVTLSAVQ